MSDDIGFTSGDALLADKNDTMDDGRRTSEANSEDAEEEMQELGNHDEEKPPPSGGSAILKQSSFIEAPKDFEEDHEKTVGRLLGLHKFALWFWIFVLLIPNIFIFIFYGAIPLGDPEQDVFDSDGTWPFLFIVNPAAMTVIGYVNVVAFFGCMGERHPFRAYVPVIFTTYIVEIMIQVPLVYSYGNYRFLGIVSVLTAYITVYTGLYIYLKGKDLRKNTDIKMFFQYLKVAFTYLLFTIFLVLYLVAFAELPSEIQPVLTFALAIILFIFRKTLLSLTDPFPIEMAMLIAAFWTQNMNDMFQVLAYPSVRDPITYIYIFFINFFANTANLIFLTQPWFTFRVWIKGVLMCKCGNMPTQNDFQIPDERGHSNNRPGYMRRQTRFYMWKVLSQLTAIVFYLGIAAALRYGYNNPYYVFSDDPFVDPDEEEAGEGVEALSENAFRNSIIYVCANSIAVSLSGVFGYFLLRYRYKNTFKQIWAAHRPLLTNRTYIGFVIAIIVHNGLIALAMVQYHERIYWA